MVANGLSPERFTAADEIAPLDGQGTGGPGRAAALVEHARARAQREQLERLRAEVRRPGRDAAVPVRAAARRELDRSPTARGAR